MKRNIFFGVLAVMLAFSMVFVGCDSGGGGGSGTIGLPDEEYVPSWKPGLVPPVGATLITVILDADGGLFPNGQATITLSGFVSGMAIAPDGAYAATKASPPDTTLNGWRTGQNGTGTVVTFGSTAISGAAGATITIYAQWLTSHTITIDANGGTLATVGGNPFSTITGIAHNATVPALSAPQRPTRAGYGIAGWRSGAASPGGTAFVFGTTQVSDSMTIYPIWAQGVAVTFDLNGWEVDGETVIDPGIFILDTAMGSERLISAPTLPSDPAGFTNGGWWPTAACNTTEWNFGTNEVDDYSTGGATLTLYLKLYSTVTLDKNGGNGTGAATQDVLYGGTLTLPTGIAGEAGTGATGPTRTGGLEGWYTDNTWATDWNPSTTFTVDNITSAVTLIARWNATVTYDVQTAEAANVTSGSGTVVFPQGSIPTVPTGNHSTLGFGGWMDGATGTTSVDLSVAQDADVSVWSSWS